MGVWNFLTKMAQGKPVFENPQDESRHHVDDKPVIDPHVVQPAPLIPPRIDQHGNKICPEVTIVSCEYHLSGENIEIWVSIRNNAPFVMNLDKIRLLGITTELDHQLRVGELREFRIYFGPKLGNTSYRDADLYYCDVQTGDYFCAQHYIDYRLDGDGKYIPQHFRLVHPIKDV